jgi:hypothetical protein
MSTISVQVASPQAAIVGGLLILAGLRKIGATSVDVDRTAFASMVKKALRRRGAATAGFKHAATAVRAMWLAVAAVDVVLGSLLYCGFERVPVAAAAGAYMAIGIAYLWWAFSFERGRSCGCFTSSTPVSVTSVARAACLGLAAGAYAFWGSGPWTWLGHTSLVAWIVLLLEGCVLAGLSPELRTGTVEVFSVAKAARERSRTGSFKAAAVVQRIERQGFWKDVILGASAEGSPTLVDHWRDGPWYYFEYSHVWDGRPATVVAGCYPRMSPAWFRIVVARETAVDGEVVAAWDSLAARLKLAQRRRLSMSRASQVAPGAGAAGRG